MDNALTTQQIIDSGKHKIGDAVIVDGQKGNIAAYEISSEDVLTYQVTISGVLHTQVHPDNVEKA